MNLKIIKAGEKEFEDFYQLFKKTQFGGYFCYSPNSHSFIVESALPPESLRVKVLSGEKPLYLAYSDNRVVGYLLTTKASGGVAFGHWLGVDRELQHKGVGSSLLSFWEDEELKLGSHVLQLWTTENNLGFYKKQGFTLMGEFPNSWFGIDHYMFYKPISKPDEKNFLKEYLNNKR